MTAFNDSREADGGYFGSGASLIITDSPSSSPILSASHFKSLPKEQPVESQRQAQQQQQHQHQQQQHQQHVYLHEQQGLPQQQVIPNRLAHAHNLTSWRSTPDVSDVPSLSLSNSSFSGNSDAPLPSPGGRVQLDYDFIETLDRTRRVAYRLAMSVVEVQRIVDVAQRLATSSSEDESVPLSRYGIDSATYRAVLDAMRSDQEIQKQQQRTSAMPSARATLEMLSSPRQTDVNASPTLSAAPIPSIQQWGPATSARRQRWITSSPTSVYGHRQSSEHQYQVQQEFQQQRHLLTPPLPATANHSHQYPIYTQNRTPPLPSQSHLEGTGRLRSLPTRSHRSMDDYTTTATLSPRGANMSEHIDHHTIHHLPSQAPALHGLFSQQASLVSHSRMTSPRIDEELDLHDGEEDTVKQSSSRQSTVTRNSMRGSSTSQLVASHSPKTCTSPSLSGRKALRRSSADVLGLNIDHSGYASAASLHSSPRSGPVHALAGGSKDEPSAPTKLSHDEIMARLQRKVKERIAAKAAAALTGAEVPPSKGNRNSGSGGRSRSGSNNNQRSRSRPPRPRTKGGDDQARDSSSRGMSRDEDNSMNIEDDERNPAGIEALLSAAAIADNRR